VGHLRQKGGRDGRKTQIRNERNPRVKLQKKGNHERPINHQGDPYGCGGWTKWLQNALKTAKTQMTGAKRHQKKEDSQVDGGITERLFMHEKTGGLCHETKKKTGGNKEANLQKKKKKRHGLRTENKRTTKERKRLRNVGKDRENF